MRELLLSPKTAVLRDIMETNVKFVSTHTDQEEAARLLSKYDFLALPVVDAEERLVGIVTVDDAIDVIQEEATEDIEKMAAIAPSDKPYIKTSVFRNMAQACAMAAVPDDFRHLYQRDYYIVRGRPWLRTWCCPVSSPC